MTGSQNASAKRAVCRKLQGMFERRFRFLSLTMRATALTAVLAAPLAGCSCDDDAQLAPGGGNGNTNGDGGGQRDGSTVDGPTAAQPDVHVIITSDNAYGFGYGSPTALTSYFSGIEDNGDDIFLCSAACDDSTPCAVGACDTFGTCNADRSGPETYVVPGTSANTGDYLYVVVWSDDAVTQGLIGEFRASDGSNVVLTGSDDWEVCATGVDYDIPGDDPSEAIINEWLGRCANGEGFSGGFVGTTPNDDDQALAVLRAPLTEPPQFAPLCRRPGSDAGDALAADAKWIWFDDDVTDGQSPFVSTGNPRGEFYIFRLAVDAVIPIF